MKKIFISLLVGLLNVLVSTAATVVEIDGMCFELNGNYAYVVAGSNKNISYSGDIIIPEKIDYDNAYFSVTRINRKAFTESEITSITIPPSINTIENDAAIGLNLKSLIIQDSKSDVAGKKSTNTTSSPSKYCFNNCTVENIYVGRKITMDADYYFIGGKSYIGTLEFSSDINKIENRFFNNTSLLDYNKGTFIIPEGIEELGTYSLDILNVEKIVLPSSFKRINSPLITTLFYPLHATLEIKAEEPMIYSYKDCTPFSGYQFDELIVPFGCVEAYREAGWSVVAKEIVAAEKVEEPEESEEPVDPATTHMIRLMLPSSGEGNCYPKFEVESGADFSILFEVEQGWKISSAVYMPEETAQYSDSPRYASETSSANIQIEPTSDPNHYRLTVSEISGSGTLTYVLEKEIATESQRLYTEDESPRLSISGGILSILTHQDSQVRVYDIRGNEVFAQAVRKDSPLSVSSLPSGVYVVKVGRSHTYKIAL